MRRCSPLPPDLIGRPFSVDEAAQRGIPPSRLRAVDVSTPVQGVRLTHHPFAFAPNTPPWGRWNDVVEERVAVEMIRMPHGCAISHLTAAVIHGFPLRTHRLRTAAEGDLHITTYADNARRRRTGMTVHPLPRDERRVFVRGVLATHPVDTWCALSAMLSIDELIEIGDHLVRRKKPQASIADLEVAVRRYTGRHGAKKLRLALELVRPGTDSSRETDLRLLIVRAGIPEPAVNISVRDADGLHVKLGDMVFEKEHVLVEYDGEQHRTDSAQYHKDMRDLERLVNSGWKVVRVTKHDTDPSAIIARIHRALAASNKSASPFTDEL